MPVLILYEIVSNFSEGDYVCSFFWKLNIARLLNLS